MSKDIGYTGIFNWTFLVKNLINDLTLDCLANSYAEYHSERVSYINLLRTPTVTLKLYHIKADLKPLVNIHTHSYNFTTVLLSGFIRNIRYSIDNYGDSYKFCPWNSITKKPDEPLYYCNLRAYQEDLLSGKGATYSLDYNIPHTLHVPLDSWALVIDHASISPSYILLPKDEEFVPGVYRKFTAPELKEKLEELQCLLK